MLAPVTSAVLPSENKPLTHATSVDSLATSPNQEDHVSMATFAGRRLADMAENTSGIIAIELLAAAQGMDFKRPLISSAKVEEGYNIVHNSVSFYDQDRYFSPDIIAIFDLIREEGSRALVRRQLTWPVLIHSRHSKSSRNLYVWNINNSTTG